MEFLKGQSCLKLYYNWDDRKTKDRYLSDYHFFVQELYNVTPSNQRESDGYVWMKFKDLNLRQKLQQSIKADYKGAPVNLFKITGSFNNLKTEWSFKFCFKIV